MTLAEFIAMRGRFKHLYLRNECFDRLGGDHQLVASDESVMERANKLAEESVLHISEATNFRRAAHVWLHGSEEFPKAETQIAIFWTEGAHLDHYLPGPDYPEESRVRAWAIACNAEMKAIDDILAGGASAKAHLLRFWQHVLFLTDWLAAFSIDHPMFWQMLKRQPFSEEPR